MSTSDELNPSSEKLVKIPFYDWKDALRESFRLHDKGVRSPRKKDGWDENEGGSPHPIRF